jgi:hypothetical protein
MDELPLEDWQRSMVRRVPPLLSPIVVGSTPVVAFGDPTRANIATLGINPSATEFLRHGSLLTGPDRRLATLESLEADHLSKLSDGQVRRVIADCANYFHVNPYKRWFNPLDQVLQDLGVSYFTDTACHLDLVQWATDPIWGRIPDKSVRLALLDDGVPHLRHQLKRHQIHTIILNGRQVLQQVQDADLVELVTVGQLTLGSRSCQLATGESNGIRWVGWSANLQSSFGISTEFKARLRGWVAEVVKTRNAEPVAR